MRELVERNQKLCNEKELTINKINRIKGSEMHTGRNRTTIR